MKTNGLSHTDGRDGDLKQMEVYKNHSKFMKNKVRIDSLHRETDGGMGGQIGTFI